VLRFALGWWPLFLVTVLAGPLIASAGIVHQKVSYHAQALVLASKTSIDVTEFGSLTQAIFATPRVLQPVIDKYSLGVTPRALLASGKLQLTPVTNSAALQIGVQDPVKARASAIANAAAQSFIAAAQASHLGKFELFPASKRHSETTSSSPYLGLILAALGGGLLWALIFGVITTVRQPLLDYREALWYFPATRAFVLRQAGLTNPAPRTLSPKRSRSEKPGETVGAEPKLKPYGALLGIVHACSEVEAASAGSVCLVAVGKSLLGRNATKALAREISSSNGKKRLIDPSNPPNPPTDAVQLPIHKLGPQPKVLLFLSAGDDLFQGIDEAAAVVAVVPYGTKRSLLWSLEEQVASSSRDKVRILAFVR
jgi:hypothetical protein